MAVNNSYRVLAQNAIANHADTLNWTFTDSELASFVESVLAEVGKVIDNTYQILPLDQASALTVLNEQLADHFYSGCDN